MRDMEPGEDLENHGPGHAMSDDRPTPETRRRENLPPQLRAISDTLDEWLHRMHGSISSWQSPDYFLVWLEERGWTTVNRVEHIALQLRVEALKTCHAADQMLKLMFAAKVVGEQKGTWTEALEEQFQAALKDVHDANEALAALGAEPKGE